MPELANLLSRLKSVQSSSSRSAETQVNNGETNDLSQETTTNGDNQEEPEQYNKDKRLENTTENGPRE